MDMTLPRGRVFVPLLAFPPSGGALDRAVLACNPRLYVPRGHDPSVRALLVLGLPGWGGRSEAFIQALTHGLLGRGLDRRLVLATVQDTTSGGPRYQGQAEARFANRWRLTSRGVRVMAHLVRGVAEVVGDLDLVLLGYSSGASGAPAYALALHQRLTGPEVHVKGAVALGAGSGVTAEALAASRLRLLFLCAPTRRPRDTGIYRDDASNRRWARRTAARLTAAGLGDRVQLRDLPSARAHPDWHWGLLSPCRFFRGGRPGHGRGSWPYYARPNLQTFTAVTQFLAGRWPPSPLPSPEVSPCR